VQPILWQIIPQPREKEENVATLNPHTIPGNRKESVKTRAMRSEVIWREGTRIFVSKKEGAEEKAQDIPPVRSRGGRARHVNSEVPTP